MPYSLFNEIRLLNYLIDNPNNYTGALIDLEDQTQLWVYAHSGWLFNKYLSAFANDHGCLDEKFPLLTSHDDKDIKIYEKYLIEDGTVEFKKNLKPFKFIQFKKRPVRGRVFVKDINYQCFNGGVIIGFSLPKGCYATTFLTNIFE